jgi:hemolysin activation/secretion protein
VVAVLVTLVAGFHGLRATAADPAIGEAAESQERFDVYEYRVLNNSVLSELQIDKAVYPFLGPRRSFADVQAARAALERTYRDAGYSTVFVDVPEQSVDSGIVRLKVTEGRLGHLKVSGARYFPARQILKETASLVPGSVPHFPDVQRDLTQVNGATRDRAVTPVLRSGEIPGTVDLELKVRDELPAHGGVEVNDRYTADTTRTRVNVNFSYDNLWRKFHSLSLQYQTAPEQPADARVIAATYVMPFADRGAVLAVYAVDTNSDVATVGTLSVLGRGRIYGARYIQRIGNSPALYQNITFGGDFKDFKEDVRLTADLGLRTPIQYANWSLGYGGTARGARTLTTFNIGVNFGLRGLANGPQEFDDKRLFARPNYFYLRADGQHERSLPLGARLALRIAGQYTTEPLVSNEQFAIGGVESVRGYLESEELGDYGVSASAELRTPSLKLWSERVTQLYGYVFFDAGVVGSIVPPELRQPSRADLSSWGLGFRFAGFGGLQAAMDWAYPLVPGSHTTARDSRLDFRVRYDF